MEMSFRQIILIAAMMAIMITGLSAVAVAEDYQWRINHQHVILDINKTGVVYMSDNVDAVIEKGTWNEVWIPATTSNMDVYDAKDESGASHPVTFDYPNIKVGGFNLKPGDHVNLTVYSSIPRFVYTSDTAGYDIVTFAPPYWDLPIPETRVKVYLPDTVPHSEVFTGAREYDNIFEEDGRTVVYFEQSDLAPNRQFVVAASFPDRYMEAGAVTGKTPGEYVPSGGTSDIFGSICGSLFSFVWCGIWILVPLTFVFSIIKALTRKGYSSPEVSMDGVGVNKNLDPVEAATLMRIDPRRVLTMIMFGLMKKGNIKLISTDPVRIEPVSRKSLNYYETLFVDSIRDDKLDEDKLLACFKVLAQRVVDKTRPYCRKETEDYYKQKIQAAWDEIKALETPELKLEKYDTNMIWLMADEAYQKKTKDYLQSPGWERVPVPTYYWWYPYYFGLPHYGYGTPTTGQQPAQGPVSAGGQQPAGGVSTNQTTSSVESFANRVSDSVEKVSAGVVGSVESFLGIRNAANAPPPVRTLPASSPASSGRSSCACVSCACACAHCACACACAGGGHGCT